MRTVKRTGSCLCYASDRKLVIKVWVLIWPPYQQQFSAAAATAAAAPVAAAAAEHLFLA